MQNNFMFFIYIDFKRGDTNGFEFIKAFNTDTLPRE